MMYRNDVFDTVGRLPEVVRILGGSGPADPDAGSLEIWFFRSRFTSRCAVPTGTRIASRPSRVERALDLMYRSNDGSARGQITTACFAMRRG